MNNALATVLPLIVPQLTPVFRLTVPAVCTQALLEMVGYKWVHPNIASGRFAAPGGISGDFWARYMIFPKDSITAAEVEGCVAEQRIASRRCSLAFPEHVFADALRPNKYNQNRPMPALGMTAQLGGDDYVVCSTSTEKERNAFIQDAVLDWRHDPAFLIVCPARR